MLTANLSSRPTYSASGRIRTGK